MNIIKYTLSICVAVIATASCNGKKEAAGPEEVVGTFVRAVAAGDFDSARMLCDTVAMAEYLDNYIKVFNSLRKEDSCALKIASSVLSGAEFEVEGIDRNAEDRIIRYRLETDGEGKSKKATVKKVEGEWRVTEITDVI